MEHFKKYSRASKENPVLLIFDNHESHISIDVVNFAKENGITIVTIPPHCSGKLQPLDVAVYSSFKSRYNRVLNNWMLSNPGKTVTIYNIPELIKTLMSDAFSQANILSGFRKSGIHPFNPDIFTEEEFMCSAVTDRSFLGDDDMLSAHSTLQDHSARLTFSNSIENPSSSFDNPSMRCDQNGAHLDKVPLVAPAAIRPYPKASPRKKTRHGRQPGKTKILTETPEKEDNPVADPATVGILTERNIEENRTMAAKNSRVGGIKKNIFQDDETETQREDSSTIVEHTSRKRNFRSSTGNGSTRRKTKLKKRVKSSKTESEDECVIQYADSSSGDEAQDPSDPWYCFVCQNEEVLDMRLCISCKRYAHEICVGLTNKDNENFICHECD
ncbi:unnamed protein product [Acanthoscelides obtectus]|uniref:Zinc finger PHD-type domain-containing protein n=2 Tax=Acanthoscelides obtectus TaxID=200917 RepID=A0A9P0KJS6_ACAOB|nr:unnamed protein product [Acanthoscelides obtectus]CAK1646563.1 hypothetical protein AOBTE_LOCUS14714 [Acanthoscelides obtectus]